AMFTSMCRQLVVLLPVAYVLAHIGMRVGNDNLVWISFPVAEIASLIASLIFFRRLYKKVISKVGDNGIAQTA
ncbi:MAG: MATE family efflux transporter, partial [Clostridia bacterium]|nr:MATE family efflux transporter [Clostridia bacterium]